MSGLTIYYTNNVAGSFRLVDTVTDTGSGPASATFTGAPNWNHVLETVSSGVGSPPTIAYTSSSYSWLAGGAGAAAQFTTSTDGAGNSSSPGPQFTPVLDNTAPAPGALTANGQAASGVGTTSYSTTTSFTLGPRVDYTDAGSGLASSILQVQSFDLAGAACGAAAAPFGSPTTVTGVTQPGVIVTGRCYTYTLTGTDNVGNTASISTTVKVDTSAPVGWRDHRERERQRQLQHVRDGVALEGRLHGRRVGDGVERDHAGDGDAERERVRVVRRRGGGVDAERCRPGDGLLPVHADRHEQRRDCRDGDERDRQGRHERAAGGAITANGSGSASFNTTGTVSLSKTDFADAESGMASNVITRATATLSGNVCGAFGGAVVVSTSERRRPGDGLLPVHADRHEQRRGCRDGDERDRQGRHERADVRDRDDAAQRITNGTTTVFFDNGGRDSFTITAADPDTGLSSPSFPACPRTGRAHRRRTPTPARRRGERRRRRMTLSATNSAATVHDLTLTITLDNTNPTNSLTLGSASGAYMSARQRHALLQEQRRRVVHAGQRASPTPARARSRRRSRRSRPQGGRTLPRPSPPPQAARSPRRPTRGRPGPDAPAGGPRTFTVDRQGRQRQRQHALTFTADTTNATGAITFPVAGAVYRTSTWTGSITGTATEVRAPASGRVRVSIRDNTSGTCADATGAFTVPCCDHQFRDRERNDELELRRGRLQPDQRAQLHGHAPDDRQRRQHQFRRRHGELHLRLDGADRDDRAGGRPGRPDEHLADQLHGRVQREREQLRDR